MHLPNQAEPVIRDMNEIMNSTNDLSVNISGIEDCFALPGTARNLCLSFFNA